MFYQRRNVFAALSQRRQRDGKTHSDGNRGSLRNSFPLSPFRPDFGGWASHQTNVSLDEFGCRPKRSKLLLLQDSQQFWAESANGISPTSSRKSVPLSANSKTTNPFARQPPVKAPFSCPKKLAFQEIKRKWLHSSAFMNGTPDP